MQPYSVLVIFSRFNLSVACDDKEMTGSLRSAETEVVTNQEYDGSPRCGGLKRMCGGAEGTCRNTQALPHLILYPPTISIISVPLTLAFSPSCYISFTTEDSGRI